MRSGQELSRVPILQRLKTFGIERWDTLNDSQQRLLKKFWSIITYKWRWQIALNVPYLLLFILDRSVPAVHQFDMNILAMVATKLHLPFWIKTFIGVQ